VDDDLGVREYLPGCAATRLTFIRIDGSSLSNCTGAADVRNPVLSEESREVPDFGLSFF
jgi:hypothetical protein